LGVFFQFCDVINTHVGHHLQEELAKFGYRTERKVKKKLRVLLYFWQLAGTYHLSTGNFRRKDSKVGDFHAFFSQKSVV
jgi:hypothetical protein